VTVSRHPVLAPGDLVHGLFGVQEHAVSDGFARNVLTNCLNWPVDHGIHKGRDMCPVFTTIRQWGDKHTAPDGPPLRLIRKEVSVSPVTDKRAGS
jgi:hypothetical protein